MADDQPTAITAEEYATWLTPLEAIVVAAKSVGENDAHAVVWEGVKGRIIAAAARRMTTQSRDGIPLHNPHFSLIPASYWGFFQTSGPNFWTTSSARFYFPVENRRPVPITIRCFGIKLSPDAIRAEFPDRGLSNIRPREAESSSPGSTTVDSNTPLHRGGRPAKAFWDDLWVEMVRLMYDGKLQFDKQAQIEKAMLDWIEVNGHSATQSTVRPRARKLYEVLRAEKDKN